MLLLSSRENRSGGYYRDVGPRAARQRIAQLKYAEIVARRMRGRAYIAALIKRQTFPAIRVLVCFAGNIPR